MVKYAQSLSLKLAVLLVSPGGSGVGVNEYEELPDTDWPFTSLVRLSVFSLPDTTASEPANIRRKFLLVSVDLTTCSGNDVSVSGCTCVPLSAGKGLNFHCSLMLLVHGELSMFVINWDP
jgi:hypothetical protein